MAQVEGGRMKKVQAYREMQGRDDFIKAYYAGAV